MSRDVDETEIDDVIGRLRDQFQTAAQTLVPKFFRDMPNAYLRDTNRATQLQHLQALISAHTSGVPPKMTLVSPDGNTWTFLQQRDYPGVLAELVQLLPTDRELRSAKVYSAADGELVLDVFRFGDQPKFDPTDATQIEKRVAVLEFIAQLDKSTDLEDIAQHFERSTASYLRSVSAARIYEHWRLWQRVRGTEDTVVEASEHVESDAVRINVAAGNADTRSFFFKLVTHLGRRRVNIRRAYLDVFEERGDRVLVVGIIADKASHLVPGSQPWNDLTRELTRLRWLDHRAFELADKVPELGILRAEVLVALLHLAHARLGRDDPFAFARERLMRLIEHRMELATAIAELFLSRFRIGQDPTTRHEGALEDLRRQVEASVEEDTPRRFFLFLIRLIAETIRTNVCVPGRYGLALRINPEIMQTISPAFPETPYAVFFVHTRGANGFHVRFRDIARGGVRVVRTLGPEQFAAESERHYSEVYNLALAQQLKNKDIPEGGAKAVILVEPNQDVDLSVKAFTDGLLDLISTGTSSAAASFVFNCVTEEERIYLGPDENISFALIDWIVARAGRRGLASPNAFMSSKSGAGINHKAYGVTSEGVIVFLEEALRAIGIDPRSQPFTVKITGGPDGDVGGNCLSILYREFGDNVRVVGIADGSGSAEDPNGFQREEILRLVKASLPISAIQPRTLSPAGRVVPVTGADGPRLRNTLHNRVVADAFVTAGGRPSTINEGNWRQYLTADGTPSSRVIVEGANLFLTDEARRRLSTDAGVIIVKDSSANKCGVITSSYEVIASLLLTTEAFMAIKSRFVTEVLTKLRELARLEARLLFREQRRSPSTPLPQLSVDLSKTILRTSDALLAQLASQKDERSGIAVDVEVDVDGEVEIENTGATQRPNERLRLNSVVRAHLPAVLLEHAGHDVVERLPANYVAGIIAKSLAAHVVYREGLDFLRGLSDPELARLSITYWQEEERIAGLVHEVSGSTLPHRDLIAALLRRGGARTATLHDLSDEICADT
ncbi:MAG: NAD-glutamate dehydrogenase [Deltaproteobacteria bacterium]|nr:NAD-glutamate dehydrogenase [Deltaproteobacteria bacterium]